VSNRPAVEANMTKVGVELWGITSYVEGFHGELDKNNKITYSFSQEGCDLIAKSGLGIPGVGLVTGHVAVSYDEKPLTDPAKQIVGFGSEKFDKNSITELMRGEAKVSKVKEDTALFQKALDLGMKVWRVQVPKSSCNEPTCGKADCEDKLQNQKNLPSYATTKTDASTRMNCQLWPQTLGIPLLSKSPSTQKYLQETLEAAVTIDCFALSAEGELEPCKHGGDKPDTTEGFIPGTEAKRELSADDKAAFKKIGKAIGCKK